MVKQTVRTLVRTNLIGGEVNRGLPRHPDVRRGSSQWRTAALSCGL